MKGNTKLPTIGLSIIVKNEEKVISRMLDSIYSIIDYFTVVDTGSTDKTKEIIQAFFAEKNIPGHIYDHQWVNYEEARNYALMQAKYKTDFSFTIDADEVLSLADNFDAVTFRQQLANADIGLVEMLSGNICYTKRAFWRNSKTFYYKYPVQEILLSEGQASEIPLNNISIKRFHDGATWNQPVKEKYLGHAKLLHDYMEKNGLDPRCVFYLAQSYKDAAELDKAIGWYELRTTMNNGFYEEIYYSRLMVGKLKWQLGYPVKDIVEEFMKCCELDTLKAEHLYELKLMYERNNRPMSALKIQQLLSGYKNPYPLRVLFLNPDAYTSGEKKLIPMRQEAYLSDGLKELIKAIQDNGGTPSEMIMIEIGSYAGESTVMFAAVFKKVIAIDAWMDGYDNNDAASNSAPMSEVESAFDENTKMFDNIVKIKSKSDDAISLIKDKVDFVYIDGMHTYEQVKKDIRNYMPLLKHGHGWFIGGHDFSDNWAGVKEAVIEMLGTPDWTFQDTSWLCKLFKLNTKDEDDF